MADQTLAERIARDAVDGLLKQASKQGQQDIREEEVKIDPETQKKLIEREVRMATDADYELAELAKEGAADRLRRRLDRPAGTPSEKAEPERTKATINQEIGATAKAMLDMGIPAPVVAQYLVGSSTAGIPVNLGGGNQGLTIDNVLTLVDRMNTNKASSELESIIKEMRDEIKNLRNAPKVEKVDPAEAQASQLDSLSKLVDSLVKLGVVQRPGSEAVATGKPLEVVKEENRHAEKMEELTTESKYKNKVAETLAELPERIGRGIAGQIADQGEEQKEVPRTSSMEHFACPNEKCGYNIVFPPGTVTITCPKCGSVYERKAKAG